MQTWVRVQMCSCGFVKHKCDSSTYHSEAPGAAEDRSKLVRVQGESDRGGWEHIRYGGHC